MSHGLVDLVFLAQRFAEHEPGGCLDEELEVEVAVRFFRGDGLGCACGDGVEALDDRLLFFCCG